MKTFLLYTDNPNLKFLNELVLGLGIFGKIL